MSTPRDPRTDPKPGDVLRRWDTNHEVCRVVMGCVYTMRPLTNDPRGWVGIQFYREWAKSAEVIHAAE